MSEKILEIQEVFNVTIDQDKYGSYDGYEIVTDKQRVKLLISNEQECCESWGYFMSEDDFEDFIGADLIGITITDSALNTRKFNEEIDEYSVEEGDTMFVNIETSNGLLQFTAYNAHNGYYSHEAYIISEQLTHKEKL
ncbi:MULTISPECIES: DUF7448 domain-containing protein [Bacillati]|uniref:DUF7448 domain-containing protein n=1 Tax=Bacillati TaxID=1783272 RepID=UPI0018AC3219|nr:MULTISPECIES: hypothetical protein [Terrabacteria group]MCB5366966.1 hypothetical protein [Collinsella aerofaciens]MCB5368993.1 hypothetical protein [Collinsella aerofaciens]